ALRRGLSRLNPAAPAQATALEAAGVEGSGEAAAARQPRSARAGVGPGVALALMGVARKILVAGAGFDPGGPRPAPAEAERRPQDQACDKPPPHIPLRSSHARQWNRGLTSWHMSRSAFSTRSCGMRP